MQGVNEKLMLSPQLKMSLHESAGGERKAHTLKEQRARSMGSVIATPDFPLAYGAFQEQRSEGSKRIAPFRARMSEGSEKDSYPFHFES